MLSQHQNIVKDDHLLYVVLIGEKRYYLYFFSPYPVPGQGGIPGYLRTDKKDMMTCTLCILWIWYKSLLEWHQVTVTGKPTAMETLGALIVVSMLIASAAASPEDPTPELKR